MNFQAYSGKNVHMLISFQKTKRLTVSLLCCLEHCSLLHPVHGRRRRAYEAYGGVCQRSDTGRSRLTAPSVVHV